jgi:hypothetical protein
MYVEGNLFEYEDTPLAHCVSVDLVIGTAIALEFKNKFQGKDELRRQSLRVGSAGLLYRNKQPLYYLVTRLNRRSPIYPLTTI